METATVTGLYASMTKIHIGKVTIGSGIQEGRIWLENEEGEGGDFPPEEIEKLLLKYFNTHF